MLEPTQTCDILIVGAGVVGLSCALAIAEASDLNIVVLDAQATPAVWNSSQYDLRVSAITPASRQFLQDLNVWSSLVQSRISPFDKMYVWDENSDGHIEFTAEDVGSDYLGFIVENSLIQQVLMDKLTRLSNVNFYTAAQLHHLNVSDEQLVLSLQDGRVFSAKLIIGADGAQSWVREHMNVSLRSWPYEQSAVVCQVQTELPHQKTARQCFLKTGPLAFLPLEDANQCSIVWSITPTLATELCQLPEEDFSKELTKAFSAYLGDVRCISSRLAIPLVMRHAGHYTQARMALIGDACHTLHPLAGQGANLGLADAQCLAATILNAYAAGRDIGDAKLLARYERLRKTDNVTMIAAVEGFKRLFSNDYLPVAWLRGIGLNIVNQLPPVKRAIIKKAMGISSTNFI